jgi:hypothetical protein
MIQFRSLKVGSGDSFLVEDNGLRYLVDSGGSAIIMQRLITEPIDIAICTHNDSDHSKGFIGLLKKRKGLIKEIWLPGVWAGVIKFISEGKYFALFNKEIDFNEIEKPTEISALLEDSEIDIDEFTDDMVDLEHFYDDMFYRSTRFGYPQPIFREVYFNIERIKHICRLAYEDGAAIKWFFPSNMPGKKIRNFIPINSEIGLKLKKVKRDDLQSFLKLAYLTSENRHSLVFEYVVEDQPKILFTADSIIDKLRGYSESIIVTAPHHGSDSNKETYKNINGNNIIWVRSDRPSGKRPCTEFLSLNEKYCLTCTKDQKVESEEVVFELRSNVWEYVKGKKCCH